MTAMIAWAFSFTVMVGGYEGLSVAVQVDDGRVVMPTQAQCEAVRTDVIEIDQIAPGAVVQGSAGLCQMIDDTSEADDIPRSGEGTEP